MKVIAINSNVYRVKDRDFKALMKVADRRSQDGQSYPFVKMIDEVIARAKLIATLDNAFNV